MNEQITRVAARVAAAFGVEEWEKYSEVDEGYGKLRVFYQSINRRPCVVWGFNCYTEYAPLEIEYMDFTISENKGWDGDAVSIALIQVVGPPQWWWTPIVTPRPFEVELIRGLYRLGFTDEAILSQLPPLSAHEQLELRLSMPREFWPDTWKEEAENMPGIDVAMPK